MSTTFSSLPIVDLSPLRNGRTSEAELKDLSSQLYNVFATTGFAYLINTPLSFRHADVFSLALEFFSLPNDVKMGLAKRTFRPENANTYRGYFPTQPEQALDNFKEGFEIGSTKPIIPTTSSVTRDSRFNLSEPNVWPNRDVYSSRERLEKLYAELQSLSATLLSLLAVSLGKPDNFFDPYLTDSLSTLRLLHYPPRETDTTSRSDIDAPDSTTTPPPESSDPVKLSCTPHTDSGILTLLHQDSTGGLEVQDSSGKWVPAPYIPDSIVVNVGDLMAKVSGDRFVATMHRVRAPPAAMGPDKSAANYRREDSEDADIRRSRFGRFSVPFFFEPGEKCVVRSVDDETGDSLIYGEHMRAKMESWVEYN